MEIVLVRHGETEWSANGRHTSRTDLGLTEAGRLRAAALGAELAGRTFSLVLTSPLFRAREWDYGDYEGLTTPQIREQNPAWKLWRDGCPGGESPEDVGRRADRAIARLRSPDGDTLAFAHGHLLRVLGARWLEMEPAAGARFVLGAGAISILGYERETEVFRRWNIGI